MKNLLFILGIILLLSSCKKEKLGGFSTPCNGKYQEHSTPYSMSLLDATAQIDTMSTCSGPNFTYPDSIYRLMAINPNNPYEIVYQKKLNPNWEVYIYNFCSNEKNLIYNNSSLQSVSWSTTGEIFLIVGATVQKIENNNASSTLFYIPLSSPRDIFCSPDGLKIAISYSDYPQNNINKIYSLDGEEIYSLPNQGRFLGWYNNSQVLTSFSEKTILTNIITGDQEIFLNEEYYSYNSKTKTFFKEHVTGNNHYGHTVWSLHNMDGTLLYEHPPHVNLGSYVTKMFIGDEKLVVGMECREFYDGTPSCDLNVRHRVIIMDMDGTNVRKVNFPE